MSLIAKAAVAVLKSNKTWDEVIVETDGANSCQRREEAEFLVREQTKGQPDVVGIRCVRMWEEEAPRPLTGITEAEYEALKLLFKHGEIDATTKVFCDLRKTGFIKQEKPNDMLYWDTEPPYIITSKGILEMNIYEKQKRNKGK